MLLKKGSVEFKMIVFEDLKDHMPLREISRISGISLSGYYYRPVEEIKEMLLLLGIMVTKSQDRLPLPQPVNYYSSRGPKLTDILEFNEMLKTSIIGHFRPIKSGLDDLTALSRELKGKITHTESRVDGSYRLLYNIRKGQVDLMEAMANLTLAIEKGLLRL